MVDESFDLEHWKFHNLQWHLGRCKQKSHFLCEGLCAECDGRIITAFDIEQVDRFAFFITDFIHWNGTDTPGALESDYQDYQDCAVQLGMMPV